MAYLFDTDAISEVLRSRPLPGYVEWLSGVPRDQQFTSAINVGELFKGAYRHPKAETWLRRIETEILPRLTVLPYDLHIAKRYGELRALLEAKGNFPGEADLQIAATALEYDLEVVTGNLRHFSRVPCLSIQPILIDLRAQHCK